MAARKKIAIWYTYHEGWIGGTYYIQNLVHALNTLPDNEKPGLLIICRSDEEFRQIQHTNYPYLEQWLLERCNLEGNLRLSDRLINKLSRFLLKKNIREKPALLNYPGMLDTFFPCPELKPFKEVRRPLYWIPDFQELHLPRFFDQGQIKKRKETAAYIAANALPVLFSSQDALKDFQSAYPGNHNPVFVVPFAVTHPPLDGLDIDQVKKKYALGDTYFFAPNQFWKHKDHITLIKAAERLASEPDTIKFQVVFTGKEYDFRNPEYAISLKQYVIDHGMEKQVSFLGFIDRCEQLLIMKYARAVVQPSLFEGWSTVIEDAKALDRPIIASNLAVHLEQLTDYNKGMLFKKGDPASLADTLKLSLKNTDAPLDQEYYKLKILQFGKAFMDSISKICMP